MGLNLVAVTWSSDIVPALSKEFLDIQANYREWIHSETRTWHDNNILSQDFSVLTQAIFALVLVLHFLPVQQGFLTFSVHKWHYCFFLFVPIWFPYSVTCFNIICKNINFNVREHWNYCFLQIPLRNMPWDSWKNIVSPDIMLLCINWGFNRNNIL